MKNKEKILPILGVIVAMVISIANSVYGENTDPKSQEQEISIIYQAHVQDVGWQDWASDGEIAGTTGENKKMEAIKIKLSNANSNIHIKYRAHVQDIGWQEWKYDGEEAGTTGQGKKIEAIQIEIEGSEEYTVRYQAHVQDIGWQEWTNEGKIAGTTGKTKRWKQ